MLCLFKPLYVRPNSTEILSPKIATFCFSFSSVVTDDYKGFLIVTFEALVIYVVLVDDAIVGVPHCKVVVVLGFDAVAANVVDVLDSHVVVAFHLAVYLVVAVVLNPLGGIKVHADIVLKFFHSHKNNLCYVTIGKEWCVKIKFQIV